MPEQTESKHRLGVVSFLNSRPLTYGLEKEPLVELVYDVPARLPDHLAIGRVDAALVPVIDLVRPGHSWKIVSDACIGCDGETLTVRVFSRVPPEEIETLAVDGDSHTSVALATVIWRERFKRNLRVIPLEAANLEECDGVLLIGDKVVQANFVDFDIETDLGGAWKSHTGLPFVFAVWATAREAQVGNLPELLQGARDRGVAAAAEIAENAGPGLGWPVALATRYLTHRLKFKLSERHRLGLELFLQKVQEQKLVSGMQDLVFA